MILWNEWHSARILTMKPQDYNTAQNHCKFRKDPILREGGQRCLVFLCPFCLVIYSPCAGCYVRLWDWDNVRLWHYNLMCLLMKTSISYMHQVSKHIIAILLGHYHDKGIYMRCSLQLGCIEKEIFQCSQKTSL